MMRLIGFDCRFIWQDGSPTEHGSPAELCFKARNGFETVICRVPRWAILNALSASGGESGNPRDAAAGTDQDESRVCEALFVTHRQMFRDLARSKIACGAFALPLEHVKSVLISEGELIRTMKERALVH